MEHTSHEPQPPTTLPTIRPYQTRHDGWTGEKMATFCEALAETAVVAEACDLAGMGLSGAYAARRRNPVFAAAWDAALSIARERLADVLLERAMEGTRELYFKDGEMVGERHLIDNRLGLAILRRLDRLAETGLSLHSNLQEPHPPAILPRSAPFDWERMVAALRSDDADEVAQALALIESNKVDEVEDPLNRPPSSDEDEGLDLTDRCWRDAIERCWMTDFPPPSGFSGYQSRAYDSEDEDERYIRTCTPDEAAVLDANEAADRTAERAQEEALRDEWFAMLRSEVETLDGNRSSCAEPRQRRSRRAWNSSGRAAPIDFAQDERSWWRAALWAATPGSSRPPGLWIVRSARSFRGGRAHCRSECRGSPRPATW